MKNLTVLFFTIFIFNCCAAQPKKNITDAQFEYSAMSRGFYQTITVQNQNVSIVRQKDQAPTSYAISDSVWKEIQKEFDLINLDSISSFKATTNKRLHDGAATAVLTIVYNDKKYQTQSFDNGTPPKEIENFVNSIFNLAAQ